MSELKQIRQLRTAAKNGDVGAMIKLGFARANGGGVPQDTAQAAYWHRKAAEAGDAAAIPFGSFGRSIQNCPIPVSDIPKEFRDGLSRPEFREGVGALRSMAKHGGPNSPA